MYLPTAVRKQPQIDAAVSEVVNLLAPDVLHIRYDIDQDWSGDWAVFFRVLLSDQASDERNIGDVARRVRDRMDERLNRSELDMFTYFNFRSQSEQAKRRDPAWA
jgi:hypothetical protein